MDRGKQGIKRSIAVDALGIPLGAIIAPANRHDSPLLAPTLDAVVETLGGLPEETSVHLDRGYDSELTCERLADRGLLAEISIEGQAGAVLGHESVGGREDEFVAQRPQEACVVHGTRSTGGRLLGGVLGGGHHREETDPGSVEPLPLGDTAASQTMTYPRKLLTMRVLR